MFPWSSPVMNLKLMTPPRGMHHRDPDRHCFDPTDTCPGVIREGRVAGAAESTGLVSAFVEVVRSRQESVQFSARALVAGIGDSLQLHQVPAAIARRVSSLPACIDPSSKSSLSSST